MYLGCRRALESEMKEQQHIGLMVDFTGLSDIRAEGLPAVMVFLSKIKQFHCVAFGSDKEWPGVVAGLIDR